MEYNESTHRKKVKNYLQGYEEAKNEYVNSSPTKQIVSMADNLRAERIEFEKEKVKFRDERSAYAKLIRNEARFESRLDRLENVLKENGENKFKSFPSDTIKHSNNDIYIVLSDIHYGENSISWSGLCSHNIIVERFKKLATNILKIKDLYNSENLYITLSGDLINGNIHKSIAITNSENVIEQIRNVSEILSEWIYELSKHFNKVCVNAVNGNHSRIDRKEDSLKDERLDNLITWYLKSSLKHIKNIMVVDVGFDSTLDFISIRGKTFVNVHGDYDKFDKQGLSNIVLALGFKPYAVTFGHLHTCAVSQINDVWLIRSGCMCGSSSDYCVEKRLTNKASQMVCVISDNEYDIAFIPVTLN